MTQLPPMIVEGNMIQPGRTRRVTTLVAATGLAAGGLLGLADPAHAASPKCPAYQGSSFSGHGRDAAIAQPTRTVAGKANAGAIEIRDVCTPATKPQAVQLPTPHAGDRFGSASVAVNINSQINETSGTRKDRYDDLLVGIPGFDVGSKRDAGAIAVFLGSAKGLRFSRIITQDTAGIAGTAQAGAHFGSSLVSDFVFDQSDIDVRVGIPDLDVGSAKDAGGIADLTFDRFGKITKSKQLTENSKYVPGPARTGDHFGAALWGGEVGVPGKTVNGHAGAGAVVAFPGYPDPVLYTQDSPCVAGTAEAGDHFGAAISDNFIGVPGEDVDGQADAGMVDHVGDSRTTCYSLTQNSPGVPGTAEAGDRFGAALGQNFDIADDGYGGPSRLLIGAPGEDTSAKDAGTVVVVGVSDYVDNGDFVVYGIATVPNPHPVAGGAFGSSLSPAATAGALIGAPGDSGGRAYLFDTDEQDYAKTPKLTRVATFGQATGTKGPSFGASFAGYYSLGD